MTKKLTQEDFINRAKEKHGNKYDYSLVKYIMTTEKVYLLCPIHGNFSILPSQHLNGQGCKKCWYDSIRKTTEMFITESVVIHGDKYDYSLVNYKTYNKQVTIVCKHHNAQFQQSPLGHLSLKQGCPECGIISRRNTKDDFIKKAEKIHGNIYDYSLVDYTTIRNKIKIICPLHGEFPQTPANHLQGHGCRKCSHNSQKKNNTQFIVDASTIHADRYDYSIINYLGAHKKVTIICRKHGIFQITPANHISSKQGCRECCDDTMRETQEEYFLQECNNLYIDKYSYDKTQYVNASTKVIITCPIHGDFKKSPKDFLKGKECNNCKEKNVMQNNWLDSLNIPNDSQHREVRIQINDKLIVADGFMNNIIYEFWGDYFHGNPNKYNPIDINKRVKKTYGELYEGTQQKRNLILSSYELIEIWESDWKKLSKIIRK